MSNEERKCTRCGTICTAECPTCSKNFPNRKNAEIMTGEERAEEMKTWEVCEIDPELVQQRIEELVGRPVNRFIEIANNWPGLIEESRTRKHPDNIIEHLASLDPKHKITTFVNV